LVDPVGRRYTGSGGIQPYTTNLPLFKPGPILA